MNGIEKITERILSDAQAEINEVLQKAEGEAASIRARYEAQAQREYEDITRRGAANAQEREENLAGASHLEARKDTLAAKQGMVDRAFALASEQLSKLPEADYISLLAKLAAKSSFSGKESLVLSAEDAKQYGDRIVTEANALLQQAGKPASLTLSSEHRQTGGGLLLSDGQIETNCTFETLLRLVRVDLSGEVAKALFD